MITRLLRKHYNLARGQVNVHTFIEELNDNELMQKLWGEGKLIITDYDIMAEMEMAEIPTGVLEQQHQQQRAWVMLLFQQQDCKIQICRRIF